MDCKEATKSYESWLGQHTRLVGSDLILKHQQMSADIFSFMRATFYHWLELWAEHCPDLVGGPSVLAIGDLHVENFGTWRDSEGRLVWGINDFDEASSLPYTNDLVRLAVSASLAISADNLKIQPRNACKAIIEGYVKGLKEGGHPYVLAERHEWLRSAVMNELRDPAKFWDKLNNFPTVKSGIPGKAAKALEDALPKRKMPYRVVHRVAGLGSLGRQRFVALAESNGSQLAREAKALVPSSCVWARGQTNVRSQYERIVDHAVRCPDPFLQLRRSWVIRRLSPDCSRVELTMMDKDRDEYKLLQAMGRETANIHLGSRQSIARVKRDLRKKADGWLYEAAKAMTAATIKDWQDWCR